MLDDKKIFELSVSPKMNEFWYSHGVRWAKEDASPDDLATLVKIGSPLVKDNSDKTVKTAISHLKAIWADGFADESDAFDWDGMEENLPDQSFVSFLQGVVKGAKQS